MSDTIYALSSGIGRAGVAVVRVSGEGAREVAHSLGDVDLAPRKATLVRLRHPRTGEVIDQALRLWFEGPRSFTGEDVIEFQVHGGRAVVMALLEALSSMEGVRAAQPGEFTRRAFQNGKLDLASVEGLADLIAADTEFQRRQAFRQFEGSAKVLVSDWRGRLIAARALLEAHLDFPDEAEIPVDVTGDVRTEVLALLESLQEALEGRVRAEIIRDGVSVLIAGPPNSGKSTLLNRIAAREVAIISDIPGTTRDLIEITIDLRGIPVTFIDSAGVRKTDDPVEKLGIGRTHDRAEKATIVLWLTPVNERYIEPALAHPKLEIVYTKCDLASPPAGRMGISAASGSGIKDLLDLVYRSAVPRLGLTEPAALTTRRQFDCVVDAIGAVQRAWDLLDRNALELVVEELRLASKRLEEITGLITDEDLLDEVFGRFCLGK